MRFERRTELRDVVLEHHRADQLLEQRDLRGVVALHQAEVEEGDDAVPAEHVVPGMRVTVERVQAVEAAEHEPEDRFGREVALRL